jgi:hypothetical protein
MAIILFLNSIFNFFIFILATIEQVRLVGGKTPNEGRVEVRAFDYGWGAICDDGFGIQVRDQDESCRCFR